ncbi:MAG TPA: sialidase family protein [Actinomycetota bacterium]|nr:sialidase family protein [Actinomycetota bacterium]
MRRRPTRGARRLVAVASAAIALAAACTPNPRDEPAQPPGPRPAPPGTEWARAALEREAESEPGFVHEIVAGATGEPWLAGGYLAAPGGPRRAAVWASDDGRRWALVDDDDFGGDGDVAMVALARGPDGAVAVGRDLSGDEPAVTAWRSDDGRTWSRTDVPSGDGAGYVFDVAATADGYVAIGASQTADGGRVVVWTSDDGARWDRSEPESFGDAWRRPISLAAGDDVVVAAGSLDDGGTVDAAFWRSDDGRDWSEVPKRIGAPADEQPVDVVAHRSSFVAVGQVERRGRRVAAAWTSDDGGSWSQAPASPALRARAGNVVMTDVASDGDSVVAVGGSAAGTRAWESRAGTRWRPLPLPRRLELGADNNLLLNVDVADGAVVVGGGVAAPVLWRRDDGAWTDVAAATDGLAVRRGPEALELQAVESGRATVVAAGSARRMELPGRDRDTAAVTWLSFDDGRSWRRASEVRDASISALAYGRDGFVATGASYASDPAGDAAAWSSGGGGDWRDARVAGLGGSLLQTLDDVAAVADGYVAVGVDGRGRRGRALIATSPDGRRWRAVEGPARVFDGAGRDALTGVCPTRRAVVAVGTHTRGRRSEGVVMTSRDGRRWRRVDDPLPGDGTSLAACAATGRTVVALGTVESGDATVAAAWTSPDGQSWRTAGGDAFGGGAERVPLDVVADRHGFTAVGYEIAGGRARLVAWTSDDGVEWDADVVPARVGGTVAVGGLAAASATVVPTGDVIAVGRDGTRAALWRAAIARP